MFKVWVLTLFFIAPNGEVRKAVNAEGFHLESECHRVGRMALHKMSSMSKYECKETVNEKGGVL